MYVCMYVCMYGHACMHACRDPYVHITHFKLFVVFVHIIIYIFVYSLLEKADKLESIRTELKSEVEKLKNDNKRCVCMYIRYIRSYIQVHVCMYVYIHVCIIYVCKYSNFQIL